MRMRGLADFGDGGLERFTEHDLGDYVGGGLSDDLASDHFAVLLGGDDFHEARSLVDRDRFADRAERKLADLHFDAARFGVGFAEADGRNFGLAVDACGYGEQVEAWLAHARHNFDGGDTLGAGLVREQGRTEDVADRVDARDARLE